MGKLIMWNVITLDGYFEGETNWNLDFHNTIWGPELEQFSIEQLEAAAYLLFGRVTYQGMAEYWQNAEGTIADWMNSLPKIVCSRTLSSTDWKNTTLINDKAETEIAALKSKVEKDIFVFGSAVLSDSLIKAQLFDEYRIGIAPVILGKGRLLFENGLPQHNLSLTRSQQLENGGMLLRYTVVR